MRLNTWNSEDMFHSHAFTPLPLRYWKHAAKWSGINVVRIFYRLNWSYLEDQWWEWLFLSVFLDLWFAGDLLGGERRLSHDVSWDLLQRLLKNTLIPQCKVWNKGHQALSLVSRHHWEQRKTAWLTLTTNYEIILPASLKLITLNSHISSPLRVKTTQI